MQTPIQIVDLFAGPGGLGEGFSSLDDGASFKITVSAEMDPFAYKTLRLRAYYRILKLQGSHALKSYYEYCHGDSEIPYDESTELAWDKSGEEAQLLTLGSTKDNLILRQKIKDNKITCNSKWVLIGGPPCQAYSLVGRSRNLGKTGYKAEDDHRHYLYREYLQIIQEFKPSVFVMENVKGILSSKINNQNIFHTILTDLSDPDSALGKNQGIGYRIHSITVPTLFYKGLDPAKINAKDFVVKSEDYGIPQSRHRVILLGIREDLKNYPFMLDKKQKTMTGDVIQDLPKLRSKLSKEIDSDLNWAQTVENHLFELLNDSKNELVFKDLTSYFESIFGKIDKNAASGNLRIKKTGKEEYLLPKNFQDWYLDKHLKCWLNHETRGHMNSDLRRYLYASSYAHIYGVSPKGHNQFKLLGLAPNHSNWESGIFSDRFRVQLKNKPATTITSHISKDGHYFIHPDPLQCRSLTVREAARLQTFPDNYFFQGNRTQQFHQVGNAVPPQLAMLIASVVKNVLE